MKKGIKIIGIILGIVVVAFLGMGAYINFTPAPDYSNVPILDLKVELTPERIANGKNIAAVNCAGCHKSKNGVYEGAPYVEIPVQEAFGKFYSSNITNDKEYGIGSYTDGELYRLLRTGVKKDGSLALPMMIKMPTCSDEDIYDLIAYFRSDEKPVQASQKTYPAYEPSMLAKALFKFAFKPVNYKEDLPQKPVLADSIAYGKYLVNDLYLCYACHSNIEKLNELEPELSENYLQGGYVFQLESHRIPTPSLMLDGNSTISKWTMEEFILAMKAGIRPGQEAYVEPMKPYTHLDTAEIRAIYHYLKEYSQSLN